MATNPRDPWIKPGTALAAPAPEGEDERDPWQKPGTTRTQGPPAAAPEPTERPGLFARALSRLNERPRPSTVEGLVGLQRFRGAATTGATDLGGTALVRPAPEAPAPLPPTDRDLAELPPGERAAVPVRPRPEDGRRPIASFGDRVPTPRPTGPTHFADTGSLEELRRAQAQAGRTQDRYTETLAREEYLKGKTPGERFKNAAVSFARSGAEMPASMLSGIAVLAKELDEITGTGEYEGKDAKDLATARAAARIREWADEHLPDDPKMRGAFLEQVLPAAFGSGAFFLATGAAGRVVGASGGAVAGVTGALSEGGSVYEEARQMGASDRTARLAGLAAMPLGATEALPVERQLGRLFGEGGNRIFREAFYGGMEEGLQELGQGVGENIVAGQSYDPGRPVGQGVGTNAFAGFLTGGLLSAGATALSPSRERVVRRFRDELAAATDRYGPDLEGISKRDARRLGRMAAEAAVAAQQEGEPTPRPMDRGGRPIPGIHVPEEGVAPVPASDEGAGVPEADPWQKPPEGAGRDNLERAPRAAQEAAGAPEAPAATEEAPVPDIAPQGEAEAGERAENESARTLGEWLDVATTPRQIQYVEEAIDEARVDGRITMEEAGRLNQQVARIKRGKPAPEAPAGPAIPGPRASSQTPAAAGRRERTITVAGNQRDMMEKRLRAEGGERWAAHERAMEGRAELFGLPPRPSPDAVVRRVMLDANGEPTAPVLALGREEQTVFPGSGEKAATAYAWVSLDETVPSHDPFSFERQPEEVYPSAIQGRAYHGERGRAARDDVIRLTGKFNSGIFLDATIMADGGVPVIAGQSYDPGRLRQLNSASDAPRGKTKDVLSDAATKAAQLRSSGAALRHFDATLGEDQTVRAYLETAAGRDFLAELVRDGVFTEGERARYVDVTTGTPTDEGKLVIERILRSAAIGDPDVVGRAPGSALRKLDSALPAIVQANQVEGWDLSPVLQEALDVLASARANGNTIEDQLGQGDLLGASVSEEAAAMARFLDGARKNEVTEAFRGYAEDAGAYRRQSQSEDMFGHRPKVPEEARSGRFARGDVAAMEPADAKAPTESFRRHLGGLGARLTLQQARQVVSLLAGKVQRGTASAAERDLYEEARSLLRRNEKLDAGEVAPQAREAPEKRPAYGDTGELSGLSPLEPGWSVAQLASERLPDAGRFSSRTETAEEEDVGRFVHRTGGEKVPSRAEIQRKISEAFQLPVKSGRLGRRFKKALGIYKARPEVVRLGTQGDIVTLAHEVGHHVQKLFFASPDGRIYEDHLAMLPQDLQDELLRLGEGISGGGLREGWAEFWRRYIDNPEVLPRRAPNLLGYIQERLDSEFPQIRDGLEEGARDWRLHREGSELARVQSQISVGEADPPLSAADGWTKMRTAVFDKFEPVRKAVQHLSNGQPAADEDAEMLVRLTAGASGIAETFLEKGQLSFGGEFIGPSLQSIFEPVKGNIDNFRGYAVSRRALELHGRDIDPGIRQEDAEAVVAQMEQHFGDTFKPAFDALQDYQDNLLRYLVDAGVISQRTYGAIKERNKAYVPFFRVMDERGGGGGASGAFAHLFSPVKRIKGSGRQIIDPFESIIRSTYQYTQLGAKQEVSQALARLADRQGAGAQLEAIETPIRRIQFKLGEIEDQLAHVIGQETLDEIREMAAADFAEETSGMDAEEIRARKLVPYDPAEELLAVFKPGDLFSKPNIISVLRDGRRQYYEVAPDLYEALEGIGVEHVPLLAKWLSIPVRMLRAGATMTAEFMIRNSGRDQFMAAIQSEYNYIPFYDMAKGIFHLLGKTDTYWKWRSSGGERASLLALDRRTMQRNVQQLVRSGGVQNVVKTEADAVRLFLRASGELARLNLRAAAETSVEAAQAALDPLARVSALMEDATRMGEFINALAVEGDTKRGRQRASYASRESTVDFARHGSKTTMARSMSAFWNARLQGYERLARAIKKDPARFAGKAFMWITLPSLIELAVNWDDDDYWDQPQWQRDLFWMFKVGDQWVRIPKPFELGLVFGTVPQRIAEWAWRDDPAGVRKFLTETAPRQLLDFIPWPTAGMPLLENWLNYSTFLDRPIVPPGEENVDERYQYNDRTSEVAVQLGRWMDTSPRKIDNLLYSWTGGLGRSVTGGIDRAAEMIGARVATESQGLAGVPGIRGITARPPGFSSESVERFYERRAQAQKALATSRFLRREGRTADYESYMSDPEHRRLIALTQTPGRARGVFEEASAQLADLRTRAERIRRDPALSRDDKRQQIEELGRRAREVARWALEASAQ